MRQLIDMYLYRNLLLTGLAFITIVGCHTSNQLEVSLNNLSIEVYEKDLYECRQAFMSMSLGFNNHSNNSIEIVNVPVCNPCGNSLNSYGPKVSLDPKIDYGIAFNFFHDNNLTFPLALYDMKGSFGLQDCTTTYTIPPNSIIEIPFYLYDNIYYSDSLNTIKFYNPICKSNIYIGLYLCTNGDTVFHTFQLMCKSINLIYK